MNEAELSKRTWSYLTTLAFLLGSGGGIGSGLVFLKYNPEMARYDPFTGTEGEEVKRRIKALENLRIPPEWFEQRVNRLQEEIDECREDINDIHPRIRSGK